MSAQPLRSSARLRGHLLHPPLATAVVGFWLASAFFDALALFQVGEWYWQAAATSLAAGLVAALPAALAGALDFAALPAEPRLERTAMRHIAGVLGAGLLLLTALLLHRSAFAQRPPELPLFAVVSTWLGVGLLAVGASFGGELVFRFGIGVAPPPLEGEHDVG